MKEILDRPIKDLIQEYPQVGRILEESGIGCVTCSVGTCLLKDIVSIHNLDPQPEQIMMTRIAKVIYPERDIHIPLREKPKAASSRKYSPPVHKLVEEHKWIKRWAALIPVLADRTDVTKEDGRQLILKGVNFIRSYADSYHHAKEEQILFQYFDQNLDILKVMLADHEAARAHVRAVVEGVEKQNADAVKEHLLAYAELLYEHIKKEDDILYPWMERQLSDSQIGRMFAQFSEVDSKFGQEPRDQEQFVANLETKWEVTSK